jgi:hypothetical protein
LHIFYHPVARDYGGLIENPFTVGNFSWDGSTWWVPAADVYYAIGGGTLTYPVLDNGTNWDLIMPDAMLADSDALTTYVV